MQRRLREVRQPAGLFGQAQSEREQAGHAWVDDPIVDVISFASRGHDAAVDEAAELVGRGLGSHLHRRRKVSDTQLFSAGQRMEQPEAADVGQRLKQGDNFSSLVLRE
jgi:hypothetical protein